MHPLFRVSLNSNHGGRRTRVHPSSDTGHYKNLIIISIIPELPDMLVVFLFDILQFILVPTYYNKAIVRDLRMLLFSSASALLCAAHCMSTYSVVFRIKGGISDIMPLLSTNSLRAVLSLQTSAQTFTKCGLHAAHPVCKRKWKSQLAACTFTTDIGSAIKRKTKLFACQKHMYKKKERPRGKRKSTCIPS